MRKALILSLLAAMTLATACKKEPIEPPPPPDPCENITCFYGGVCIYGLCECPAQYTGPSCSQEVHPIKMKVTKIKLTDFPPTDAGGGGWDLFDGPDVFLAILKNGVNLYQSGYVEDLTTDYEWTVNFEFTAPVDTYQIKVLDYDDGLSTDDLLGQINFTPYKPGQKFPTSYSISCSGCAVAFQFTGVQYFH